jgi:NAD(P)H dehydrogenase (quinone)
VPETLPQEVLTKMYAPPKPTDIPVLTDPAVLKDYDGILIGISTRYGNFSAQLKTFWDSTGQMWQTGAYYGKYAGIFVSTSGPGGGQESSYIAAMSTLVHHGMIYVPLGYAHTVKYLANFEEVNGGSPWGAGTFSKSDGSRQPSASEKEMATIQGKVFTETVAKATGGK